MFRKINFLRSIFTKKIYTKSLLKRKRREELNNIVMRIITSSIFFCKFSFNNKKNNKDLKGKKKLCRHRRRRRIIEQVWVIKFHEGILLSHNNNNCTFQQCVHARILPFIFFERIFLKFLKYILWKEARQELASLETSWVISEKEMHSNW